MSASASNNNNNNNNNTVQFHSISSDSSVFDSTLSEIESKREATVPIFALFLSKKANDAVTMGDHLKETINKLNRKAILIIVNAEGESFTSSSLTIKSFPSLVAIRRGRAQGSITDLGSSSLLNDFLLTILNRTAVAAAVASSHHSDNHNNIVQHEEIIQESLFDDRMKEIEEQYKGKPIFVMVIGDRDACSLQSWCPDCVVADPIVISALNKVYEKTGAVLVEAPVQRSSYKGNPSHPYRIHSQLLLKAVPTLYRWKNGKTYGSLVEEELFKADDVEKFVSESF